MCYAGRKHPSSAETLQVSLRPHISQDLHESIDVTAAASFIRYERITKAAAFVDG
jgi:hypothetical protein